MKGLYDAVAVFKEKIFYLNDGGPEAHLIANTGYFPSDLPAFELLSTKEGQKRLKAYYESYLLLAAKCRMGFVMQSPTIRASADWGVRFGYTHDELFAVNKRAIKFMREVAMPFRGSLPHIIISGAIGPRCEQYNAATQMTAGQASVYHMEQVKAFALADADMITVANMEPGEAEGVVQAAGRFHLPVVVCG